MCRTGARTHTQPQNNSALRATCIDLIRTDLNSRRSPWARFLTFPSCHILADKVNGIDSEKHKPASPDKDPKTSAFKRYLPGAPCQNMDLGVERGFQTGRTSPVLSCLVVSALKKSPQKLSSGSHKDSWGPGPSTFFFTVD